MACYGYIRVSSCSQNLESQHDDLVKYGVSPENIYADKVSGVKDVKENLNKLMAKIQSGDTLVVSRWDRISRSLQQLLNIVEDLTSKNINLVSIHENVDLSTSEGKLFISLFGMLAEYQRNIIKERQAEGIQAAKARGRRIGGRNAVPEEKIEYAITMYLENEKPVREICSIVGISRSQLYKQLKLRNIER